MKYSSTVAIFLLGFLPWVAHALPVDLSIPVGGLGPTTSNGYAEHWLELGDFDFGGGLSLPLRVNLNSGRQVEFVGFGKGSPSWRAPELHAKVLDKDGDRRGVMLPCGKMLYLFKQAGGPDQFATEDGEWNGSFHGLALVLSRADGWELEYNAAGWLSRLHTDTNRTLLWNRAANQNLLSITEQLSKTGPGGQRADANGITGLVVKRDPVTGAITGFDTHTPFGNTTYTLGYDDQQRLRSVTFPNGQTELYSYGADKEGNPEIQITGRDLVSQTLRWSRQNQLLIHDGIWSYKIERREAGAGYPRITRTGPGGETESLLDDSKSTGRAEFVSADGTTTIRQKFLEGPARGKLESITRLSPVKTTPVILYKAAYDDKGMLVEELDALGNKTVHAYVLWGPTPHAGIQKHVITNALGQITSQEYDRRGNQIRFSNPVGLVSTFTYDSQNRRLSMSQTSAGGTPTVVETVTYTKAGRLASRADALGNLTRYEYDARGNRTKTIDALGQVATEMYDSNDNCIRKIDPLGHAWAYEYDQGSRLIKTTAPDGQVTEIRAYNALGKVASITDASGNVAVNAHDAFGRVTSRTDALGRTTGYSYDVLKGAVGCQACNASSMPTLITLPSGRKIQRLYDVDKRIIEETVAFGTQDAATTKSEYDLAGRLRAVTDPLGRVTRHEYNAVGNRIKTTFPDGSTQMFAYNAMGQGIAKTDELGQTRKNSYDAFGNLLTQTDAAGNVTTYACESKESAALHRLEKIISPEGRITRTGYDALGRRITLTTGELAARNSSGPAVSDDVATTTHKFDAAGNEIETIDPRGKVTKHTFDSRNRRISTSDALGRVWQYHYATSAGPSGNAPCCGADPSGNARALETLFPDGSKESRLTDAAGQLIEMTDAKGDYLRHAYDLDGHLETLTDGRGNVTKWRYDARGKLAGKVYPDKTTELYEYDAGGQLIHRIRPDSTAVTNTYDPRGHLLSTVWSRGDGASAPQLPGASHYEYDKAGHLTKATNPSAEIARTYTATGKLESETQRIAASFDSGESDPANTEKPETPSYQIHYTYTPEGKLAAMHYPDGTEVAYTYTARNQLGTVTERTKPTSQPKVVATYTYRKDGKASEQAMGNGVKTLKLYDAVGRLEKIMHLHPGGTELWSETSRYDRRDRRTARVHGDETADLFAYDPAGQVTAAAYGQASSEPSPPADNPNPAENGKQQTDNRSWQQHFEYDPAGNRKAFQDLDGSKTSYQTNEANQYTAVGDHAPRYDTNGNLLTDQHNTYTWDADIHLLSVTTRAEQAGAGSAGQKTQFRYDALNRRVARLEARGTLTHFVHDGWNVIAEYTAQSKAARPSNFTLHASHVWGNDISGSAQGAGGIAGLLKSTENGRQDAGNVYHYDSNGNVVLLTTAEGKESARYSYDAFGKTLTANGQAAQSNKYRFSTKPVEEASGLAFYGFRYYSPELGRWISRDPIAENGGRNLYGMVGNGPVTKTDNLGLFAIVDDVAEGVLVWEGLCWLGAEIAALWTTETAVATVTVVAASQLTSSSCPKCEVRTRRRTAPVPDCEAMAAACVTAPWRYDTELETYVRCECSNCYARCVSEGAWPSDEWCEYGHTGPY